MPLAATISKEKFRPHLEVTGECTLSGEIKVSGAKNSALVLLAASLMSEQEVVIKNVPKLTDIDGMAEILNKLGVLTKRQGNEIYLTAANLKHIELPYELVHGLRASFFCIGALLGRLGKAKIPLPGGCQIGARPVVEHIRGLKALGAFITVEHGLVTASVPGREGRLKGANVVLDCPSVGATETILMAAVLAEGKSTIENAALEPEVQDLANMLNSMGAKIKGAGGPKITIEGVCKLNGCNYTVMPDRIEAGTFLIAAAITQSKLKVAPVITDHINSILQKLRDCGCKIEVDGDGVIITPGEIVGVDITTQPFPGFPTDLQAPFMALMTVAKGTSVITEKIYENRMQHISELQRMGASIRLQGNTAVIEGVPQLSAAPVLGGDLRSSAAMVIASMKAKGISKIEGLQHLDRGYEAIEKKLNQCGANIIRNQH